MPQVAHRRIRPITIGLVDDEHIGDLEDAGLGRLDAITHPRRDEHKCGVRK